MPQEKAFCYRGGEIFGLGATAVGIGRPYIWGLGAFGQAGVERVIDILHEEMILTMKMIGVLKSSAIGAASIIRK